MTISVTHSCGTYFGGKRLRSAILFKAERGLPNALVTKMMRFNNNNVLVLRISKICSRSNHKFAEKLLNRSKLLNKVSVMMDYNSLDDLMGDDFDISLVCKRFPSIILGSAPPIKLYEETTKTHATESRETFQTNIETLVKNKMWPSLHPDCLNVNSVEVIEEYSGLAQSPQSVTLETEKHESSIDTIEKSSTIVENEEQLDMASPWSATLETEKYKDSIDEKEKISAIVENEEQLDVVSPRSATLETEKYEDSIDAKGKFSAIVENEEQLDVVSAELFLDKSISCIPELSKRSFHQLENCGFYTLRKILHHFPRTYADLQNPQVDVGDGQYLIFVGKVLSSKGVRASSLAFLEVVVGCEVKQSGATTDCGGHDIDKCNKQIYFHLKKFFRGTRFTNQFFLNHIAAKHKVGGLVCVSGKMGMIYFDLDNFNDTLLVLGYRVKTMLSKEHYEMREYNIDVLKDEVDSSLCTKERPLPIYPSKGGMNPDFLRDVIARALQTLPISIDPIPKEIVQEFGLLSLHDAYIAIHQPKTIEEAELARKRLIFDEFFYLQLGRLFQMLEGLRTQLEKDELLAKYKTPKINAVLMEDWSSLTKKILTTLPYSLTSSQLNAVSEIIWDLKRQVPMNRLLQGEVGCGKTVVAFLACMEVIASGYQAAFMVPTELLAIQHYEHILDLLTKLEDVESKPSVALLTGSTPLKQARMIRQDLQAGNISMVIGTHSLIADKIEFSALRIAVVDEQHRFGVIQRGRFNSKLYTTPLSSRTTEGGDDASMAPHVLAMSATPIPRSLALALYGDMSLTQITGLPPGRIPVKTYIKEGTENGLEQVYKMILDELKDRGKIYLVYPVIEPSEQLPQLRAASADLDTISSIFSDYNCGLLHGKLKSHEKEEALNRFRYGQTHILLSTQVIEIGVDIPDASMMVVMNAERFGIAQLHQLRGRVGRGGKASKCILVGSGSTSLERLKVLEKSTDGFYLANMDLLIRGPGDLLGKKQSGHLPEFPIARLELDGNMLQEAHEAALKILSSSHDLKRHPALKAELSMRQPLCLLGD
ncbi:hypothetical protein ACFE04_029484 [Oxalis oulophora]